MPTYFKDEKPKIIHSQISYDCKLIYNHIQECDLCKMIWNDKKNFRFQHLFIFFLIIIFICLIMRKNK